MLSPTLRGAPFVDTLLQAPPSLPGVGRRLTLPGSMVPLRVQLEPCHFADAGLLLVGDVLPEDAGECAAATQADSRWDCLPYGFALVDKELFSANKGHTPVLRPAMRQWQLDDRPAHRFLLPSLQTTRTSSSC